MPDLQKFLLFAAVGAGGFVVDSTALYLAIWSGLDLYSGRLISYMMAATFTWAINRRFTFKVILAPSLKEWAGFISANAVGGLVNYIVYALLITFHLFIARHPILGVGAGAIAGLTFNFFMSAYLFERMNKAYRKKSLLHNKPFK